MKLLTRRKAAARLTNPLEGLPVLWEEPESIFPRSQFVISADAAGTYVLRRDTCNREPHEVFMTLEELLADTLVRMQWDAFQNEQFVVEMEVADYELDYQWYNPRYYANYTPVNERIDLSQYALEV